MPEAAAHIVFRVDAAIEIGTGHVMRCLTLADELRQSGARCRFICRAHPGHLRDRIAAHGHDVQLLPVPDPAFRATPPPHHAGWLGTDWQTDAQETLAAIGNDMPDWLVVDHYALDARWETQLRRHAQRIMVLDDLADRAHDCDLLLDPGIGRSRADYAPLLPAAAQTLLGPGFALLRPEFAEWRARSLARRRQPHLQHVLVTMGGVDKSNASEQVLEALDSCQLPADARITVALGDTAPALAAVRARSRRMRYATEVLVNAHNMAELMAASDLAIGAAGSTSWERCCLGLPTLILALADNQTEVAAAVAGAGAAIDLGRVGDSRWQSIVRREIDTLATAGPARLARLATRASAICDGGGATRATQSMLAAR